MLTKKDFVHIAGIINNNKIGSNFLDNDNTLDRKGVVDDICAYFKEANPNFNESKFRKATGE